MKFVRLASAPARRRAASVVMVSILVLSSLAASPLLAASRRPACGGIAGLGCGAGMFCETPAPVCGAFVAGRCEPVPLGCPRFVVPVCGCNDKTYANDCERKAARVSKAHNGPCL